MFLYLRYVILSSVMQQLKKNLALDISLKINFLDQNTVLGTNAPL